MSTSAHYVTQSSIYDSPVLGPLTNRRINEYKKQGRYAGSNSNPSTTNYAGVVLPPPVLTSSEQRNKLKAKVRKNLQALFEECLK